jgi:hypothetical protein
MLINWQDYILAGYETHGPSFFFEPNAPPATPGTATALKPHHSIPSPPYSTGSSSSLLSEPCSPAHWATNTAPPLSPRDEIIDQCEEFIDFLKRSEQLAINQRRHFDKTMMPARFTSFRHPAILYQILAAPPGARFSTSGNRKQLVARMVALMMLNAALWDYRYTLNHSESFLKRLEQDSVDSEVDMSGSVEALLQIMLDCRDARGLRVGTGASDYSGHSSDSYFPPVPPSLSSSSSSSPSPLSFPEYQEIPDFTQYSPTAKNPYARPWFAGRMLKIAKRLSPESWTRVTDILFSCLTMRVAEPTPMSSWENKLRREILSAPLTNYIMPVLQG